MIFEKTAQPDEQGARVFLVIHPLDDMAETKLDPRGFGVMPMTRSVRVSLMVLRGYLVAMVLLVFYHALDLAGVFTRRY